SIMEYAPGHRMGHVGNCWSHNPNTSGLLVCGAKLTGTSATIAPESLMAALRCSLGGSGERHGSRERIPVRTRAAIAFLLTCASALAAQELPVVRARTDAVYVPVTVTDRAGGFARGLTADQFEISEDGTRRAVAQFSAGRV